MQKIRRKIYTVSSLVALGSAIVPSLSWGEKSEFAVHELERSSASAEHKMSEGGCGGNMHMDANGMVMNQNKDTLPKDCPEVSEDVTLEVKAGVQYAQAFPGTVFGFNEHQWAVKPCARVTVKFTNEDHIRHQWMIHGLPQYLYPEGMFHLEVNGQHSKTGTFILPSSHYTYLVHCDIAQHAEKGMKAQLVVGKGRGDLSSIPGISAPKFPDQN